MKLKTALMRAAMAQGVNIQPNKGHYAPGLGTTIEASAITKRNYEKRKAERWKSSIPINKNNQ